MILSNNNNFESTVVIWDPWILICHPSVSFVPSALRRAQMTLSGGKSKSASQILATVPSKWTLLLYDNPKNNVLISGNIRQRIIFFLISDIKTLILGLWYILNIFSGIWLYKYSFDYASDEERYTSKNMWFRVKYYPPNFKSSWNGKNLHSGCCHSHPLVFRDWQIPYLCSVTYGKTITYQ